MPQKKIVTRQKNNFVVAEFSSSGEFLSIDMDAMYENIIDAERYISADHVATEELPERLYMILEIHELVKPKIELEVINVDDVLGPGA